MELNVKKICIFAIFVSLILFFIMLVYVWNFTVDDAFISFRYSEHLARGYGLIWNIGQSPAEGYTNFLWILIIAFLFLFKLNPVFLTKMIGLLSISGIMALYWFISNDMFGENRSKLITFTIGIMFLLINPYTVIHTVSGLETNFFAFLLLVVAYCVWKIVTSSNNSKFMWLFSFTALLLSLSRPEGIFVSLGLLCSIIYISYRKDINNIKLSSFLPFLILYLIPITVYMLLRVLYFNELFPLPFLAKIVHSITYPMGFLLSLIYLAPFVLIIVISLYIINNKINVRYDQQKMKFNLFLFVLSLTIFFENIVYVYTPAINFGQRFFYPSFVLVYVMFGTAISILFVEKNRLSLKITSEKKNTFTLLIILVILIFSNFYGMNSLISSHNYADSLNNVHVPLGKTLNTFADDNYSVFCGDAGSIAYYSGWDLLDGLNDRYIVKNGTTLSYLELKHPELFIFISFDETLNWTNQPYAAKEYVLKNNYTQLAPIKFNDNYYLIPFLRPNIKDYTAIKNSIEIISRESMY